MLTKISILGLTEYTGGSVWDQFQVPAGLYKQDVIDNILMQCAELSLVYTEPETMTRLIGIWSRKNLENWTRIMQALTNKYNPLHNYDRTEEWSDTGSYQVAGFDQGNGMADRDSARSDRSGHVYGNIGVTTAAQMIVGEMDVRVRFNTLDAIAESFKNEFCVQIY